MTSQPKEIPDGAGYRIKLTDGRTQIIPALMLELPSGDHVSIWSDGTVQFFNASSGSLRLHEFKFRDASAKRS